MYEYRIKIAGEVDENKMNALRLNLQKFSPEFIGEPKTTPIQARLSQFPEVENERVTSFDIKCRYPMIEPFIKQIAQLIGMDENRVRIFALKYDDGIKAEMDAYDDQENKSPLLLQTELGEAPGAKDAAKAYGNSYLNDIQTQTKDDKIDIPYAAKKTANSFDPFKPYTDDNKLGSSSPFSKVTRPKKPATGSIKG